MSAPKFRNDRTAGVVDTARRAFQSGNHQRALDLLAEADGLEAWAYVSAGADSRALIGATIARVRGAMREAVAS